MSTKNEELQQTNSVFVLCFKASTHFNKEKVILGLLLISFKSHHLSFKRIIKLLNIFGKSILFGSSTRRLIPLIAQKFSVRMQPALTLC